MKNILKNEPKVSAEEILFELFPLLKDYFEGEFKLGEKEIIYSLPNGQQIYITATLRL